MVRRDGTKGGLNASHMMLPLPTVCIWCILRIQVPFSRPADCRCCSLLGQTQGDRLIVPANNLQHLERNILFGAFLQAGPVPSYAKTEAVCRCLHEKGREDYLSDSCVDTIVPVAFLIFKPIHCLICSFSSKSSQLLSLCKSFPCVCQTRFL